MAELAFNLGGERFEVPASVAWWRVRRLRDTPRAGPEVVFARDGLPLVIAIDAGIEELRRGVDEAPGRYRLDPIDEHHQPVPNVPAAYIQINKPAERNAGAPASTAIEVSKMDPRDELMREIVRVNAEVSKTLADRFASVMESAACLLKAADGAGLPARPGMVIDVDAEDGDDTTSIEPARPPLDLMTLLGQAMPFLCTLASQGGLDLSKLAGLFGLGGTKAPPDVGAKASKPTTDDAGGAHRSRDPDRSDSKTKVGATANGSGEGAATVTATAGVSSASDAMARFLEIQAALTPEERTFVQAAMADAPAGELAAWREQLSRGSVDEAVRLIRAEIAKVTEYVKTKEDVS